MFIERRLRLTSTQLDLSLELFITPQKAKRNTPRTVENYRLLLTHFLNW